MNGSLSSDDPLARPAAAGGALSIAAAEAAGAGIEEARRGALRILRFLGRRWWVLLLVTGGLLYGVTRYAAGLPRTYACAPAVLELVQEAPPNAASMEAYDYASATLAYTVVPTQQAVLATSQVLDPVVEELGLKGDPTYGSLGGRVVTSTQEHTCLISLTVHGPDPEANARIANAIARVYRQLRMDEREKFLLSMLASTDAQVARRQEELKAADEAIQAFRARNHVVDVAAEEETIRKRLGDLFPVLNAAEEKRDKDLEAEAQVVAAEKDGRDVGDTAVVREDPEIRKQTAELRRLKQNADTLASTKPDDNRELGLARAQVAEQTQTVKSLAVSRAEDLKLAAAASRSRAAALLAKFTSAEAELRRVVGLRVEFAGLEAVRAHASTAWTTAREDSRSLNDLRSRKAEPVRVRQWAQPSSAIVSPKLSVIYAGGGILAFALAVFVAFLLDLASTRLRDPEEIHRMSGAPFLGAIPFFRAAKGTSQSRLVLEETDGAASEAYRLLAATALLHGGTGEPPKTLLVTSPQAGEGKTTTAIGLAMALARRDRHVLLVDADLRRPTLHQVLGTAPEPGLTTLFGGGRSVWDVVRTVVVRVAARDAVRFDVLTAGLLPPNPADLLSGPRMHAFLAEARSRYDAVVIDSPPVNLVSDVCLLAPYVDGLVMVIREGRTHRGPLHRALARVRGVRGALRGVLVNGVRSSRGDGYGYGYGYGYGPEASDAPPSGEPAIAVGIDGEPIGAGVAGGSVAGGSGTAAPKPSARRGARPAPAVSIDVLPAAGEGESRRGA